MTERKKIYDKTGGRCFYCGKGLEKIWHVDHIEPIFRGRDDIKENNGLDNLAPSCPRCNRWKATFSVEDFRAEIKQQVDRLRRDSPAFRLAMDYGIIKATDADVVFYHEREND